uniref:Uncharacterized protein n=1 Tax=Ditylenchus dipsaci TaxID=166011 RepID=A0A915E9Q4_9BILA
MEVYLFRREKYLELYNCSFIDVDQVPLKNRQHVAEGVITIVLCAIYYGAVFCSHPDVIYRAGLVNSFFWISESVCEVALVLNRCLAIIAPKIEKFIFGDPYEGYVRDSEGRYNQVVHIVWDMTVALGIPVMYIVFMIVFTIKIHTIGSSEKISHRQKMVIIFC